MRSQYPYPFELHVYLDPLLKIVLLVVDIMTLRVIFYISEPFRYLELSHSCPKSFMIVWY